jgi:hypothetical protein
MKMFSNIHVNEAEAAAAAASFVAHVTPLVFLKTRGIIF